MGTGVLQNETLFSNAKGVLLSLFCLYFVLNCNLNSKGKLIIVLDEITAIPEN